MKWTFFPLESADRDGLVSQHSQLLLSEYRLTFKKDTCMCLMEVTDPSGVRTAGSVCITGRLRAE
jgi:hypothetical protein